MFANVVSLASITERPSHVTLIDIASGTIVAAQGMPGTPDYVRFSPATNEVWVSLPGTNRSCFWKSLLPSSLDFSTVAFWPGWAA
jgi:hypothetical protein